MSSPAFNRNAAASQRRSSRASAFTLVEFVSTMVISVIMCGSAGSLLWDSAQQRSEIAARSELIDIGSAALERMVRSLRDITQDECPGGGTPCLNGNAQVSSATATQIRWGSNGIRLSGTEVQLTTNNAANWYTLAADATDLQLIYYNRTGQDLQTLSAPGNAASNMRRVSITLKLGRANQNVTLRTGLYLRNFMNEVTSDP